MKWNFLYQSAYSYLFAPRATGQTGAHTGNLSETVARGLFVRSRIKVQVSDSLVLQPHGPDEDQIADLGRTGLAILSAHTSRPKVISILDLVQADAARRPEEVIASTLCVMHLAARCVIHPNDVLVKSAGWSIRRGASHLETEATDCVHMLGLDVGLGIGLGAKGPGVGWLSIRGSPRWVAKRGWASDKGRGVLDMAEWSSGHDATPSRRTLQCSTWETGQGAWYHSCGDGEGDAGLLPTWPRTLAPHLGPAVGRDP
ncbi:hypothetical protein S40285_10628 [Stachybotrys chlorohalonatus IBT 40285]|uniref:Uncharacterized protein n=1 Tax=Stachybotrys chlorohalonatus (strain IBT 40285) TaxID=1283841 RepID=A0A084QL18_STAC4|nr:hypothetical protein S40285_10628 [Stachybotrys chlorohalonata IBT 40285]